MSLAEWVEIVEPRSQEHMYANLSTGECAWDPPEGVPVRRTSENQWWELFDHKTSRFYYYNAFNKKTVWCRPDKHVKCDIIPLARLQCLKEGVAASKRPSCRHVHQQTDNNYPLRRHRRSQNGTKLTAFVECQVSVPSILAKKPGQHIHANLARSGTGSDYVTPQNNLNGSRFADSGNLKFISSVSQGRPISRQHSLEGDSFRLVQNPPPLVSAKSLYRSASFMTRNKVNSRKFSVPNAIRENASVSYKFTQPTYSNCPQNNNIDDLNRNGRGICDDMSGTNGSGTWSGLQPSYQITNLRRRSKNMRNIANKSSIIFRNDYDDYANDVKETSFDSKEYGDSCDDDNKVNTLRKYVAEQAKLSGYRVVYTGGRKFEKNSESEEDFIGYSLNDSDDFADDEGDSEICSTSRASSTQNLFYPEEEGDFDGSFISEPTYNNIYRFKQRETRYHGGLIKDTHSNGGYHYHHSIDGISDEFDATMRLDKRRNNNVVVHNGDITTPRRFYAPAGAALYATPYDAIRSEYPDQSYDESYKEHQHHLSASTSISTSVSIHSALSNESHDIEKSASENLNVRKKGLFRKKMTLRDILSWTRESLDKPLTCLVDKTAKKTAIRLFRLLQIYMGDRKAKSGMTINSVALDITCAGYAKSELRDEIYIQMCKQTTENPRKESLRRGWELYAICLAFFPPSNTFTTYLQNYIQRHLDPSSTNQHSKIDGKWPIHVQISHYAGICAKRLHRMGQHGRLDPRKPSLEEVDQSRLQIFRPSMFGGTLHEVMSMQRDKYPSFHLPWILNILTHLIIKLNGLVTEGIFRVAPDCEEVMSMKSRLDQWEVPLNGIADVHVPAALLKLWLRELYEPLIPDSLYDAALMSISQDQLVVFMSRLPPLNRSVLSFVINFMQTFTKPEVVKLTKMDAYNLATVFAPNILRCPSKEASVVLENSRRETAFIKHLIINLINKN